MKSLSRVRLLATPWTAAYQAPPSMGFSRQEYWSGVPLPSLVIILLQANTNIRREVGDREGLGLSEHVQNPTEVQASSPLIPTRSGMEGRLVLPSLRRRSPRAPAPGAQSPSVCRIAGNRFRLSPSCTRSPGSGNSGSFRVIYRRSAPPWRRIPAGNWSL